MADYQGPYTGAQVDAALKAATDHDQRLVKVEKTAREQADILTKLTAGAETEGSVDNKIHSAVKWGSLDD